MRNPAVKTRNELIIAEPLSAATPRSAGLPGTIVRIGGVAVLLFVVLFWRLGTPTFWDPDEAHYAETSREMILTGDWWAPHYNEQAFFDKPVLFHQLQAAAMRIVSDSELGARAVPALAALGLVVVTYWFARSLISRDVAIV